MDTLPPHAQNDKPLRKPGVYLITNSINGNRYVGSSVNVRRRWNEHRSSLNKGSSTCVVLQRAWTLHGASVFVFSVLEYVDIRDELTPLEQRYIDELQPEYNAQPIVDRPGPRIYSEATRAKISASLTGRKQTEEQKAYKREIMTGRQFTPEWIEHLKEAQARRVITDEDKAEFQRRMNDPEIAAKRNKAIKGKKRTPEQRQRMSESHSKRLQDPETRNAFLASMNTPEMKAKRSETRSLRKQAKLANNNPTLWDGEELAP